MLTLVSEEEIIAADADVTSDRSRLTYRGFRTERVGTERLLAPVLACLYHPFIPSQAKQHFLSDQSHSGPYKPQTPHTKTKPQNPYIELMWQKVTNMLFEQASNGLINKVLISNSRLCYSEP